MRHYFKTDKAIDERFLGLLEDSIYYNPQLTRDDKDALVTSLYSLFYEADKADKKYTMHNLENNYVVPLADEAHNELATLRAQNAELVAMLIKTIDEIKMGFTLRFNDGDWSTVAEKNQVVMQARAILAKYKESK